MERNVKTWEREGRETPQKANWVSSALTPLSLPSQQGAVVTEEVTLALLCEQGTRLIERVTVARGFSAFQGPSIGRGKRQV